MNIIQIDQIFSEKLESLLPQNELVKNIMLFVSSEWNFVFLYPILAIILIYIFRNDKFKLTNIFLTIILSFLLSKILKNVFDRDRPYVFENLTDVLGCYWKYSFPSGHATLVFWLATTLSLIAPKYKYYYFWLATVISYARIYLNCHYFGDILAWVLLGFVIAYFVYHFTKKFFKLKK